MQPTQTIPSFDLLPLAWWQNPWYLAACAGIILVFGVLVGFIVWWRRRALTPEEIFLQRLSVVLTLPATSQHEQKKIYEVLTIAIKAYGAKLINKPARLVHGLTDQEFVRMLYSCDVGSQLPRQFASSVEVILTAGAPVKFSQELLPANHIKNHALQLQALIEQHMREHPKKRNSSRS